MLFIGVALLVAAGLALVIAADAGSLVGLTQDQTAQVIPLVLILILVAGGAFGRRQRLSQIMVNITLWLGIFGVIAIGYTYRHDLTRVGNRVMAEFSPGSAVVSADGSSATFHRRFGGSFRLDVTINGVARPMIFDTGASAVVLTLADAEAAGIDTRNLRFDLDVQTANGVGRAALTRINTIRVGDIERRNIRAFVAGEDALETSLLGMTFLETLSGYAVSNDALGLRD